MPYVTINIVGKLSKAQKAEIAEKITDTLEKVAKKPRSYTSVVFQEYEPEDYSIAGKLLSD